MSEITLISIVTRRLLFAVVQLFAVSVIIFAGTEILPGDVASAILGQSATPQAIENIRRELNLDQPAVARYLSWLGNLLKGDLGVSLTNQIDIASSILPRLRNTLFLSFWAAMLAVPLAIGLGVLAVRYHNRATDRAISFFAVASTSLPEFFIGYLLIYWFAVKLEWLPSFSSIYDGMTFLGKIKAIVLPVLTLTLVVLAHMMRNTRAVLINIMQSPYIETAKLKGLGRLYIIVHHAIPNVVAPIVNVVMLNLAFLVVGVVVVEVICVYPGMGQYLVDHVAKRDMPVVQAVALIFAAVYIGLILIADITAVLSNPRLRHPR